MVENVGLTERIFHAKETDGSRDKYYEHPVVKRRKPTEDVFPNA